MITDFGTLVFQRNHPPCQWKKVRDISTIRKPRIGLGGTKLIDDDQRVHVTLHNSIAEVPNCPAKYLWSSTGEPRIRVVQKIDSTSGKEDDLLSLEPQAILWNMLSTSWERGPHFGSRPETELLRHLSLGKHRQTRHQLASTVFNIC